MTSASGDFRVRLTASWYAAVGGVPVNELVGRPRAERRARWLRSMRGEDEGYVSQRVGITLLERIVMVNVYACMIAFAAWYVFFAGVPSPSL